jgi:hypothetical protein
VELVNADPRRDTGRPISKSVNTRTKVCFYLYRTTSNTVLPISLTNPLLITYKNIFSVSLNPEEV